MSEENVDAVAAFSDAQHTSRGQRRSVLAVLGRAYRRHPLWMLVLPLVVVTILVLAYGGYFLGWDWTGFKGNTFWDWLSLLITVLSIQQSQGGMEASLRQQQDAMVEAYFDHKTHLLVETGLLDTPPESPVRAVARARTVATMQRVGQTHKTTTIRFLDESGLTAGVSPILNLTRADSDPGAAPTLA
jgi:hypothetical protein